MASAAALRGLDLSLETALAEVGLPAYLLDREGTIRWLNRAAVELVGDAVGRRFARLVAPEDVHAARDLFARMLLNRAAATDFTLRLLDRQGRRLTLAINSVPIRDGERVIGVFGLARPLQTLEPPAPAAPALTPRQHEVLRLLCQGLGTSTIAATLGLSEETVRNHIRALLAALNAHSRLEALALARRHGLLP